VKHGAWVLGWVIVRNNKVATTGAGLVIEFCISPAQTDNSFFRTYARNAYVVQS